MRRTELEAQLRRVGCTYVGVGRDSRYDVWITKRGSRFWVPHTDLLHDYVAIRILGDVTR